MQTRPFARLSSRRALAVAALGFVAACSDKKTTEPTDSPASFNLTAAQVQAIDSIGDVVVATNPAIPDIQSLMDSTLGVLTAGIEARRVDVSTNLTTAPLYFVGIHRVIERASGSFSTWNIVGIDDPAKLASIIQVSGFKSSTGTTAPTSVSGTIGDGSGAVNGALWQIATGGVATRWAALSGTVSFTSGTAGAACPGFVATAVLSCAIETMQVRFDMTGTQGGSISRTASVATDVAIPTMRLTYVGP
jgi:hypothetical protein